MSKSKQISMDDTHFVVKDEEGVYRCLEKNVKNQYEWAYGTVVFTGTEKECEDFIKEKKI